MGAGTFAKRPLEENLLAPGTEGRSRPSPRREQMTIYDAFGCSTGNAELPLLVIAGKEYGSGSSRDWAARARACSASAR